MSRCDDQKDGRKLLTPAQKNFGEDSFFTGMSAPAQNDRPTPIDSQVAQHSLGEGWIDMDIFRIVLDAANDVDAVWENADGRPAIDILRLSHADQIEKPEGRSDKKSKQIGRASCRERV